MLRGVELDPVYIDVILRRYEAETGQSTALEGTGETFDELLGRGAHALCGDGRGLSDEDRHG